MRTSAAPCKIHRDHSPNPQRTHIHHIVPSSWGGPDTDKNKIPLCPTSHDNIHVLLGLYRKTDGKPWQYMDMRTFGWQERALAKEAWDKRPKIVGSRDFAQVPDPKIEDD